MDGQNQDEQTEYVELARRLSAAYISEKLDVSLNSAYTKYTKDMQPGQYWIDLAIMVTSNQA
jgi:hypothetical protein